MTPLRGLITKMDKKNVTRSNNLNILELCIQKSEFKNFQQYLQSSYTTEEDKMTQNNLFVASISHETFKANQALFSQMALFFRSFKQS